MASPRIIEDARVLGGGQTEARGHAGDAAQRNARDRAACARGDPSVRAGGPLDPRRRRAAAGPGAPQQPPAGQDPPPPLPNPPAAGGMTYVRCHGAVPKGDAPPPPLRAWSGAVYGRRGADTMTIGGARSGLSPSVSPSALMRAATAKCSSLPSQPGSTPASVTYTAPGSPTPGASRPCWNSNALSAACSTSASPSRVRSISCLLLLRTAYRRFLCRRAAALRGGVPNASERARSGVSRRRRRSRRRARARRLRRPAGVRRRVCRRQPPPNRRRAVGLPGGRVRRGRARAFPKPGSLGAFAASSPTPKYSRSGERPGGRATRSP